MPAISAERAPQPSLRPTIIERPLRKSVVERMSSAPLSHVPLERKGVNEHQKHVAGHELNHALTAYGLGVPVISISVIPEGDSLGRNIFGGGINPRDFQIIATAGSIATHDGTAKGFGSDLHTAHLIEHYYDGIGVDQARNIAIQHVMSVPRDVRERAAEIIAYLGEISGSLVPSILHRAEWEIKMEEEGLFAAEQFAQEHREQQHEQELAPPNFDTFTIIERFVDVNGNEQMRWKVIERTSEGGNVPCPVCKQEKGHEPGCVLAPHEDRVDPPRTPQALPDEMVYKSDKDKNKFLPNSITPKTT